MSDGPDVRVAALDFGSNTVGSMIAERRGGEVRFVARDSRFVRLSEGLEAGRNILPEALARTRSWVREIRASLDESGVERVRAVGTAVLREADNAVAACAAFREDLRGVEVEVISGEEEARLTYHGVRFGYPDHDLAVIDIGGASTEVMLGAGHADPEVVSLPLGAVNLTERCGEDWDELPGEVRRSLEGFRSGTDSGIAVELTTLGGTGANLAMMDAGVRKLPGDEIEGWVVGLSRVRELREAAAHLRPAERIEILGIPRRRADILIAGLALLEGVMEHLHIAKIRASRYALRHGVVWSML